MGTKRKLVENYPKLLCKGKKRGGHGFISCTEFASLLKLMMDSFFPGKFRKSFQIPQDRSLIKYSREIPGRRWRGYLSNQMHYSCQRSRPSNGHAEYRISNVFSSNSFRIRYKKTLECHRVAVGFRYFMK